MELTSEVALTLFKKILRIRMIEEEVARRYGQQQMRCPVHLSVGQEATPVGVCATLNPDDYMVGTHRAHAHYLAKGGSLVALISELYGKVTGCARGQGGSMHLIDLKVNYLGATSIVGGTVPIGVGAAFGASLRKEQRICVIGIGDTVLEEGVFHESANFASLHKLPVLFMCENNNFSCYSPLKNRQPSRPLTDVAIAHGMRHMRIDGNNVFEVYESLKPITESIRRGEGPVFVEFPTYRLLEHCGPNEDDNLNYRENEEVAYWMANDPIHKAREILKQNRIWNESVEKAMTADISTEIQAAFQFAADSPFPTIDELGAYTYAK